ncbi:MAG: ATPase, T2SS/T4P/T4SS family, partial [Candidatus Bipolaricaulaceae bacterium]
MLKRVLFAGLVLSTLALSGCLFIRAPSTGVIEGYVTNHLSGEPVAGALVKAWPMDGEAPRYTVISDYYGASAVTDAEGYYRLVVPEGLYVVEVRKDGHATSRVEGVKVASTARVDIVQKPVFNPNWPVEPPKVTVTGVTEGMIIFGPIDVKIDAQGPNDINLIYAAFGKMPGAALLTSPRAVYINTYTTGPFTINPAAYGVSGWTTFEVVVYDWNENRTHVSFRVYVEPAAAPPAIQAPLPPTANILVDTVRGVLIPPKTALAVTRGIKIISNMNLVEHRHPQDGAMTLRYQDRRHNLRVSTLPTAEGEKVVLRILEPLETRFDLSLLGLEPRQEA